MYPNGRRKSRKMLVPEPIKAVEPANGNGTPEGARESAPDDWFYQTPFANRPDLREAFEHGRCLACLRLAAGDLRAVEERLTVALRSRADSRDHVERALRQVKQTMADILKTIHVSGKAAPAVQSLEPLAEDAAEAQGQTHVGGDICP